jgi:hypothetical protein
LLVKSTDCKVCAGEEMKNYVWVLEEQNVLHNYEYEPMIWKEPLVYPVFKTRKAARQQVNHHNQSFANKARVRKYVMSNCKT